MSLHAPCLMVWFAHCFSATSASVSQGMMEVPTRLPFTKLSGSASLDMESDKGKIMALGMWVGGTVDVMDCVVS